MPYIESISTAWMRQRKCNSCHNVTFLVWTHNLAAARGFDIDRTKLAQWTKWSLADSLSDRYWFKLRPEAITSLKADALPAALLEKLKPLEGTTYTSRADYLRALDKAIGPQDLAAHQDRLVKAATLPNNGGGPDTLSQLLLGQDVSSQDPGERESYAAIHALLLQWQEPDGSWQAQGQLPGLKWAGPSEMHEATTLWSLLALTAGTPPKDDALVVRSRERALESLKETPPESTLQTLALHVILAHQSGDAARSEARLKQLLARQNPDGGWSWVQQNKTSDAFATGQALYALGSVGRDASDAAVSRTWELLLRTQASDGSWPVPQEAINTRRRGLNVYTYWGTAWATIGMLQTLPPAVRSP